MRKWVVISIILIALSVLGYFYLYQNHREIIKEEAVYVGSAEKISQEFRLNYHVSEQKYLNKTLEIFGNVTTMNSNYLTLNDLVFCQFSNSITPNKNQVLRVKGRFIGYDDLLEQIKLDQCIIIN